MKQEIIRADRRYRRRMVGVFLVIVCLGAAVIGWGLPWAERALARQQVETVLRVLQTALLAVFLGLAALGLYVYRIGRCVMEQERFPPANHRVIRDTRLIQGEGARTRGRLLVFFAFLMVFMGLFGAFYVPHVLDELVRPLENREEPGDLARPDLGTAGVLKASRPKDPSKRAGPGEDAGALNR
jgi:MFS family permease